MATLRFSLGLSLLLILSACSSDDSSAVAENDAGGSGGVGGAAGKGGGSGKGGAAGKSGGSGQAGASAQGGGGTGGSSGSSGQAGGGAAGQAGAAGGVAGAGGAGGAAGGGASGQGGAGAAGAAGQAGASGQAGAGGLAGGAGQSGASGQAGMSGGSGQAGAGGAACVPVSAGESVCDGKDDDCNGLVDDLDAQGDGFCDCLRLGILGNPGSNPSANFQQWLQAQGTTVERLLTTAEEPLDLALLGKFDVVVLDQLPRPYTNDEANVLAGWISQGGGVISMTGYSGSPAPDFYPNVLLAPLGLAYEGTIVSSPASTFFPHPTTKGISSPITFAGGYLVGMTEVSGGKSTLIASNANGNIAYAHERGLGRSVVWGDEWIEFDSEWQQIPEIKQLWANFIGWVSPQNRCQIIKP